MVPPQKWDPSSKLAASGFGLSPSRLEARCLLQFHKLPASAPAGPCLEANRWRISGFTWVPGAMRVREALTRRALKSQASGSVSRAFWA